MCVTLPKTLTLFETKICDFLTRDNQKFDILFQPWRVTGAPDNLGGGYPPRPTALTDNTLFDLHNISYDTQPHSLIVK